MQENKQHFDVFPQKSNSFCYLIIYVMTFIHFFDRILIKYTKLESKPAQSQ